MINEHRINSRLRAAEQRAALLRRELLTIENEIRLLRQARRRARLVDVAGAPTRSPGQLRK